MADGRRSEADFHGHLEFLSKTIIQCLACHNKFTSLLTKDKQLKFPSNYEIIWSRKERGVNFDRWLNQIKVGKNIISTIAKSKRPKLA